MLSLITRGLALGVQAVVCTAALAGSSNSLMDFSSDGKLLACSNRDSGTVTIVDAEKRLKLREIAVGHKPEGVTFLGDSHRLAVAVYADDQVVFVDADQGEVTGRCEVWDEPYGVVSARDGSRIWVTLEYPGQLVEIDTSKLEVVRTSAAGSFPRGLALSADQRTAFVTEYLTATVRQIDLASGKELAVIPASSTDNLARQIVRHPTRPKLYVPHMRSKVTAAHGEGSIFPYVSVVDVPTESSTTTSTTSRLRKRIPMDSFLGNLVTSNPWEIDISPDGQQAIVVFGGTDDFFACHVLEDNYRELAPQRHVNIGRNPRAVKYAPDGRSVWIYHALDFNVVAYDPSTLSKLESVAVTDNPLGEEILLGKRLFYSALLPMASRRWISCSSCHPDGDADGRTWQNPEGLRNTPPLGALAWTHPQHWSADRDETQDFEHTIRSPLMQGRGLINGPVAPSLGPPNKGRSRELDALAAYTNSHTISLSPHAKNGLSDAAKRGRELFFSKETACATCHSGPFFTDSNPVNKPVMHDVGTGRDDRSEKMGTKYDTPTLLGVYRSAPYLHDGSAKTLRDVLTTNNVGDLHGKTSHLAPNQIDDLVEFLKALPYEDPQPAAVAAGLQKIDR
jgi:DNA-binding beta-propeller fold protein YncE